MTIPMKRKTKILLIQPEEDTFILRDLDLLKKRFIVRKLEFNLYNKGKKTRLKLVLGVLWADVTFSWFADRHAYWAVKLSRLLKKKSIVHIGGYDVANNPEYGLLNNPNSLERVRYALENCSLILSFHDSLKKDAIENLNINAEKILVIPPGYDFTLYKPYGEKEDFVLTVCEADSVGRLKVKGIDIFIQAAKLLEDTKFIIVGLEGEALDAARSDAPNNVTFIGRLPSHQLIEYFQRAKVCCQLSLREVFPNALSEAMLCECVPVGTNRGGIPTVIGDSGFYVPYGNPEATAEAIKKALVSNKGKEARERIKNNFPMEKREEKIVEIIERLVA
jgi:glycosyltransferase involved in cell wall biosynthesis